jgi:hypothetical protein
MDTGYHMSLASRREYLQRIYARYEQAEWREKRRILDEFCANCHYHRKHAIRLLHGPRPSGPRRQRRRGQTYGGALLGIIRAAWEAADYPWSARLKALLPDWLPWIRRRFHLTPEQERQLLAISARTLDDRLRPYKQQLRRRLYGRTKPGTLLKQHIPLKTDHWDVQVPGYTEIDLVSHSGNCATGEFCYSLNVTDIDTDWTETRAVLGRSQQAVCAALEEIRQALPFPLRGIDSDNGSEFINAHLVRYCRVHDIQFTRGRPYKKDDNAHIEQKNWTHVRRLLGYLRYDTEAAREAINDLYRQELREFANLFLPSVKLAKKERVGSQLRRHYEAPQTPWQRVAASAAVDPERVAELRQERAQLDPFQLSAQVQARLEKIYGLSSDRRTPVAMPAPEAVLGRSARRPEPRQVANRTKRGAPAGVGLSRRHEKPTDRPASPTRKKRRPQGCGNAAPRKARKTPKTSFPLFPPRLEIRHSTPDSHISTATATTLASPLIPSPGNILKLQDDHLKVTFLDCLTGRALEQIPGRGGWAQHGGFPAFRNRDPIAREEVGGSQTDEDSEPEERRQKHHTHHARTPAEVHEEKHHQRCLAAGDDERHNGVPLAQIHICHSRGQDGQRQEHAENGEVGFLRNNVTLHLVSPSDQIQEREEKNPDNVHEMPVEAGSLHRIKMVRSEVAFPRLDQQHAKNSHAYYHVQRVYARHDEIETEKQFHGFGVGPGKGEIQAGSKTFQVIVPPLEGQFDDDECQAQRDSQDQESDEGIPFSHLRGTHRQRHGQAAANQHGGIDGADGYVQHVASCLKTGQVEIAIDGVTGKDPAEEHHLGGEEDPHTKAGGFVLLLQILELMRQRARGMTVRQLKPPSLRTRKLLPSPQGSPQSSRSEVAKAFPTPGPWHPKGLVLPPVRIASTKSNKPGGWHIPPPVPTLLQKT